MRSMRAGADDVPPPGGNADPWGADCDDDGRTLPIARPRPHLGLVLRRQGPCRQGELDDSAGGADRLAVLVSGIVLKVALGVRDEVAPFPSGVPLAALLEEALQARRFVLPMPG